MKLLEPVSSIFLGRLTCELEGSTWEVGSSDGANPGPMGLSVVIRLGCPRRVRVMVVGTFKPEKRSRVCVCICHTPISFPGEFLPHSTPSLASHLGLFPSWVIYTPSVILKGSRKQPVFSQPLWGMDPPFPTLSTPLPPDTHTHIAKFLRVDAKTLVGFNSIPSPCKTRRSWGKIPYLGIPMVLKTDSPDAWLEI